MIRVRFAPSPTGNPHVGNIRTALFDFLFAKSQNGKFILRVEDTDKKREVRESYEAIYESLKWLKLNWDEGPILQSERLSFYKEHAKKLVDKDLSYEQDEAIYFKTPKSGKTSWIDLVGNKKIEFDNSIQEDFVILKSDGFPTYHLASVVDDHLMDISHVLRGEDWISSTPKHIMLYQAFGWALPQFGHFPNILATDRSKLSKRHGSIGVLDFKKDGFLPEALVNFLALLGWMPPQAKELLSLEEMTSLFKIKDINSSAAVFDLTKLEWMNGEYIRAMSDKELTQRLQEFLVDSPRYADEAGHPNKEKIAPVVPLIKERIKKLSDFVPLTDFLFEKPEYKKDVFKKILVRHSEHIRFAQCKLREESQDLKSIMRGILETLEKMKRPWSPDDFEKRFRQFGEEHGLSATQTFQLIRVAISGQTVTPPLFESIKILGEEETMVRLRAVGFFLRKFPE